MTNREAFNEWILLELDEQIKAFERFDNEALVNQIQKYPASRIEFRFSEKITQFIWETIKDRSQIPMDRKYSEWVVEWLNAEYKES